jgi:hypothetical protein
MSPDLPHPHSTPIQTADDDVLRLRTVHRAAAELRRGIPVIL